MDWGDLGQTIVEYGAPLLGGAIGGPGGMKLGSMIADMFGGDPDDPASLARAVRSDPEAATKLAEIQSGERIRLREIASKQAIARIEAETAQQAQINETMRAELQSDGRFKSGWRPYIGWIFGTGMAALIGAMVYAIVQDPSVVSDQNFTGLLVWLFVAMASLLGVNIAERTKAKAMKVGHKPTSIGEALAKRIGGM